VAVSVELVAITEQDWRQVRDLRVQALADTPHAFLETFLHAVEQPDEEWKARARRCQDPDFTGVAAVVNGRWVGTMRAVLTPDGRATLIGVFVAPGFRGRRFGVTDRLLDAIELWVRDRGLSELHLEVHADNARAQAFYLRRGYEFTGVKKPYPLDESEWELEMRRPL
jgi:ribosomal protein S18 acetylase RimI-like enzyme